MPEKAASPALPRVARAYSPTLKHLLCIRLGKILFEMLEFLEQLLLRFVLNF